jgi:shikimate kinase
VSPSAPPSLFLIGPRGAGKSTAGRRAAARLGVPFTDADEAVEQRAGCSIAALFAGPGGEAAFRALERSVMMELLRSRGRVVGSGGGCVLDPEVRRGLRRSGRAVWLTADPVVLARRIRGSDRPSLTGASPAQEVAAVARQREPLYRECAARTLDTGPLTVQEVVDVIEQLWAVLPHHHLR